jgi:hypothetical protein
VILSSAVAVDSPSARLASMLAAARAAHSLHYVTSTTTGAKKTWVDFVGDAGVAIGVQQITFHKNGRVGHVTVIATPAAAYVRGDAFTLINYMLFSVAAATKYQHRWILIPKGASGYPTVSAGVMLASVIKELFPPPHLTFAPSATFKGERVSGVQSEALRAGKPVTLVKLYARSTGQPLPVEEVATQNKLRWIQTMTWDLPLRIATPSGATPVSVVVKTTNPALA